MKMRLASDLGWRLELGSISFENLEGGDKNLLSQPTFALIFAAITIACVNVASAQSPTAAAPSAPVLTLADAIRLAIDANPQYQTAKLQAAANLEQYKAQRTQYFPTLYTAGLYGELINKIKIGIPAGQFGTFASTGPVPATDTTLSTPRRPFSLVAGFASQPLTGLIGLHYSINAQRLMAEAKAFQAAEMRQQQITLVEKTYTQVIDAELQAASSAASLAAASESSRIAHARRDQATVLQSQVDEADAQVASIEAQLQQDNDQVAQKKEQLNQLIGRDVMSAFTTEPADAPPGSEDLSDESLRTLALRNRSELKADDASLRANELQIKAIRAKYIPDISASLIYIGLPNSVRGLPNSFTTIGAQLTWSPWDWGQKNHQIKAQHASLTQSLVQRDQDRNQVIAEVNQAARTLRERRSQMRAAELGAKAKRSRLLELQEQVRNKTALLSDLLQAQANDTAAQTQLAAARNGLLDSKAQLQQAVGGVQ